MFFREKFRKLFSSQLMKIVEIFFNNAFVNFNKIFTRKIDLRFKLRNKLIYYINFDDERKRLCVFNIFEKNIFELIYNY